MPVESFQFECTACGKCCQWGGYVCLYPSDVTRMSKFLKITPQELVDRYTKHIIIEYGSAEETVVVPYLTLNSDENGEKCVFLKDKLCSIHEAKPVHCAASPLLAEFLLDSEGWDKFEELCPGMGQGPVITRPQIDKSLEEQATRDMEYEEQLEKHNWDLAALLGVQLPEPELIPDIGFEVEIEE